MGQVSNTWTAEKWGQHLGQQVKVHPPSNAAGRIGKLISAKGVFELSLTLELSNGEIVRPYAKYCELLDDAPVPGARPQVKAQPDLATFFKGPTNYKQCPKCRTGKLVPMFSGSPLCDQACERRPPEVRTNTYWATGNEGLWSLWEHEEDARYWVDCLPQCLGRVEWLYEDPPKFVCSPDMKSGHGLKGGYSDRLFYENEKFKVLSEELP